MEATRRFENCRPSRLRHCTSNVNPPPRFRGTTLIELARTEFSPLWRARLALSYLALSLWVRDEQSSLRGWREAPGGVVSRMPKQPPTLHIVRSAHDLLSLPTSGRDKK